MSSVIGYEDLGYELDLCNPTGENWAYDNTVSNFSISIYRGKRFFEGYAIHAKTIKGNVTYYLIEGDGSGFITHCSKEPNLTLIVAKLKDIMISSFRDSEFNPD